MGACSSASPLASRQSCSDSSLLFFFFPPFLSHPFLYATFANLPRVLCFLSPRFPTHSHPPLPDSCSLFVLARAVLQLPHIWREGCRSQSPLPLLLGQVIPELQ